MVKQSPYRHQNSTLLAIANQISLVNLVMSKGNAYTDLMAVNGEPEFNGARNDEILNPMLIVEVLSIVLHSLNNVEILLTEISRRINF